MATLPKRVKANSSFQADIYKHKIELVYSSEGAGLIKSAKPCAHKAHIFKGDPNFSLKIFIPHELRLLLLMLQKVAAVQRF